RAARDGVEIAAGGDVVELDGGYYLRPTLLTDVTPDMRIAQEEVFGPVTSVIPADDDDEAIAIANATRFGLSAAVFTRDERRIRRALLEIDAGIIHVNNATTGSEPHVPFGGMRESSSQGPHEQGETARDFFTELKTAYLVPGDAAP
ncbi:MAG: aldehyde dehydrogenase family protein, partial [Candidatus Binatia bacterium]